jgi:tight adherence protein B
MRNLYFRVGTDDLPLFVTAVAIQGSTGGNLGEILENLSVVIRQRFKMRRKIRALAAEGRAAALILSSLPIGMFAVINFVTPDLRQRLGSESDQARPGAAAAGWASAISSCIAGQFQDLNDGLSPTRSVICSATLLVFRHRHHGSR